VAVTLAVVTSVVVTSVVPTSVETFAVVRFAGPEGSVRVPGSGEQADPPQQDPPLTPDRGPAPMVIRSIMGFLLRRD
jgi:hypothetical protein